MTSENGNWGKIEKIPYLLYSLYILFQNNLRILASISYFFLLIKKCFNSVYVCSKSALMLWRWAFSFLFSSWIVSQTTQTPLLNNNCREEGEILSRPHTRTLYSGYGQRLVQYSKNDTLDSTVGKIDRKTHSFMATGIDGAKRYKYT